MHLAVMLPSEEMSKWLIRVLDADGDVDWSAVDEQGRTPAQLAKELNRPSIVKLIASLESLKADD
jgi:hypothetical protein